MFIIFMQIGIEEVLFGNHGLLIICSNSEEYIVVKSDNTSTVFNKVRINVREIVQLMPCSAKLVLICGGASICKSFRGVHSYQSIKHIFIN